MKSICIKINNQTVLNNILIELDLLDIDNVYFSKRKFSNYENIIVHYLGDNDSEFIKAISSLLSYIVLDIFEEDILNNLLCTNYFYFSEFEYSKILSNCYNIFIEDFNNLFERRFTLIFDSFVTFFSQHKSVILQGFINFRLGLYLNVLNTVLTEAINTFVIEKEYTDFVSLLQVYVGYNEPNFGVCHLIYHPTNSKLLDDNSNEIELNKNISNTIYLSDISFSNNDYILNTLLDLLPSNILIHTLEDYHDDFVASLLLIFKDSIKICSKSDCTFCSLITQPSPSV